jgi:hypothetical protein
MGSPLPELLVPAFAIAVFLSLDAGVAPIDKTSCSARTPAGCPVGTQDE